LFVGEEDPPLPLLQNLYPSMSALTSSNRKKWVEIRVRALPWSVYLKTLKRDLMDSMKLTPNKLKALCEVDWPTFGIGWSLEGSLDKTVVNEVFRIIVGNPGYPDLY
jgi:hypothetical protein